MYPNIDNLDKKHYDAIIEKAMLFSMNGILEKYCENQSLSMDIAHKHELEIKRYLALSAINPNTTYGMHGPLDELWHTFILFTRKYADFCNLIAGHYIHHSPSVPNEILSDNRNYENFLADYRRVFREEPPHDLWPRVRKRKESCYKPRK